MNQLQSISPNIVLLSGVVCRSEKSILLPIYSILQPKSCLIYSDMKEVDYMCVHLKRTDANADP